MRTIRCEKWAFSCSNRSGSDANMCQITRRSVEALTRSGTSNAWKWIQLVPSSQGLINALFVFEHPVWHPQRQALS